MGEVLYLERKGPRRQRGFIQLPDPMTVFTAGLAVGMVLGIGLCLFGLWVLEHITVGWQ